MAMIELQKKQLLHAAGSKVEAVEIVLKGQIRVYGPNVDIILENGSLIGCLEEPDSKYRFNYQAVDTAAVYSYPYESNADIEKTIRINAKISNLFAASAIQNTYSLLSAYASQRAKAVKEKETILNDYGEFKKLAKEQNLPITSYHDIEELQEPPADTLSSSWEIKYLKKLSEKKQEVSQGFFSIDPEFCIATTLFALNLTKRILTEFDALSLYSDRTRAASAEMRVDFSSLKSSSEENLIEDSLDKPEFNNVLDFILSYADMDSEFCSDFKAIISHYRYAEDINGFSDEMRVVRKEIVTCFYQIYSAAFFRAVEEEQVPIEIKMFFLFGFIDEHLAGEENTEILYKLAKRYRKDPNERVFTIYEWLMRIYFLENNPSKNGFDTNFLEDLREKVRTGEITKRQASSMEYDRELRVQFEIDNLFSMAHRMTCSQVSTFVPIFDKRNVNISLEKCFLTSSKIHEGITYVLSIDYSCYCRSAMTSFPRHNINQFGYSAEVLPYFILMPTIGQHSSLWQEIDGKVRTTPARMVCPIFFTDDFTDSAISLTGAFRWEMCKREQGGRWNDIRDPSLTSKYFDYLQFNRKNKDLTLEAKERIKTDLQRARNNYRNMFVMDYMLYIKYESTGAQRLNRIAREILFEYCPFREEIRQKLANNPQYQKLIEKHKIKSAAKLRVLSSIVQRIGADDLPNEVRDELELAKA